MADDLKACLCFDYEIIKTSTEIGDRVHLNSETGILTIKDISSPLLADIWFSCANLKQSY